MAIEKIDALLSLTPNAEYVLKNNELTWLSEDITQPTEEEITAEQTRLQAEYDALAWKRNRQAEYPSHEDCIHALLDGGETLENLQTLRQTIKNKYPKE